ncbi:TonB-dependent receptor [Sphingomonas sp. RRHST34]|uniref:TonB-dependent receptor n=1 Tax=Sphingomonas citri TaxID=2862499 RepID=A0ABS7BSE9_9SPHN|nr:TonB-dependent receptor [Sphingomonas citri]MBW6532525.1 TonB-dependent receptor [Sphingomonas citri]
MAARRVQWTGGSVIALCAVIASGAAAQTGSPPVTATQAPADDGGAVGDIVVTGVRSSLDSAQELKRNSDQIVDSIQAQDIGKLPDANTVESLQRITGVQIQRRYGEGGTDVDHRTQPAIAIRGLTQVRTLIDGRDTYSASGGRNFDIEALPPELLAGIDVFKNPSAEVIEGGIGGVVNLRTRLPFDQKGEVINATARANYYDLADAWGGSGSALYSNRWQTGLGEMGLLLNGIYSKSKYRQDALLVQPFFDVTAGTLPDAPAGARAPLGFQIYDELGSRERLTLAGAYQWTISDRLGLTLQALHSRYRFLRTGRYFYNITHGENPIATPGASFGYADDGRVTSGSYDNMVFESARYDQDLNTKNTNLTARLAWQATDTLSATFDAQYLKSSYDVDGNGFVISQFRDPSELPSATPNKSIVDFNIAGDPRWTVSDPGLLTDPSRYRFAYLADYLTRNDTDQLALRYDLKWEPVDSIVKSITAGVRYADSNVTLRGYGVGFCTFTSGNSESCAAPAGAGYIPYSSDREQLIVRGPAPGFFEGRTVDGVLYPGFPPGSVSASLTDTFGIFGAQRRARFYPAEINRQTERTLTSYASARLATELLGVPIDGSAGIRLIRTRTSSVGYLFPQDNTLDPTDPANLTPITVRKSYLSTLPSVNLRALLTDQLQLRFAFAKAMARPDFTQMATNVTLGPPNVVNPSTGRPGGSSGNPLLDPIRSTQFDASLEWYFARAGSLTAGLFHKDVAGFLTSGRVVRDFGGVPYDISTTINSLSGKVKGFEVAYQQFYDFLPGLLGGLGLQANYTYVDSSVQNPFATPGSTIPTLVPLEKLSKHSYNIVGLYERGPMSARLAYNWRGRYLDTTVGSGANGQPQIQAPYASLDASVSYNITAHVALSVEAVNLNNRMNETFIGTPTEPLQYTLNDRRFGVSLRATY